MKTMKQKIYRQLSLISAATFIGLVSGVETSFAQVAGGTGNNFNKIISNMESSISGVPGLISGVSYMMGILLGVLGVLKIKDHVEDPQRAPLQQGAIRLAAGGALFALPIVYEAMQNTIGTSGTLVESPKVKAMTLDVTP